MTDESEVIPVRPQLLLLAPFLATLVIFVPNLRVIRDISAGPYEFGNIAIAMMVCCLVVSCAFALSRRLQGMARRLPRLGTVGAAALYEAGQVALWLVTLLSPQTGPVIPCAIGVAMGVCLVPLLAAWQTCYSIGFRAIMLYGALSGALAVLIDVLISALDAPVAAAAWCLAAGIGAISPVVMTHGRNGQRDEQPQALRASAAAPDEQDASQPSPLGALASLLSGLWLPLLGLLICMLSSCMAEVSVNDRLVHGEFMGIVVAAALTVALCLVRAKSPFVLLVDKIAVPALVAGTIFLSAASASGLSTELAANLTFVPLMFISLYALASVTAVRGYSRIFIASVTLSACCLAMFAGSLLMRPLALVDANGNAVRLVTFAYYGVVLIDLGYTAWKLLVEKTGGETVVASPADAVGGPQAAEEVREAHVATLAAACGLTNREREVLSYLARGNNSRFIAKALLISDNTVRTHMRSIYRKLDVSTQSELVLKVAEGR